jgi:hypothetical protein
MVKGQRRDKKKRQILRKMMHLNKHQGRIKPWLPHKSAQGRGPPDMYTIQDITNIIESV